MARAQKLKVFRTAIGFHDAYVAAPSRKAALAAWGSEVDLFARGVAELVNDEALAAEPLASPGQVIRRSRGSLAEQIAALPPDAPRHPANTALDDDNGEGPVRRPARARGRRPAARTDEPDSRPTTRKPPRKPSAASTPKPKPKPRPSRAPVEEAERALEALDAAHRREAAELREAERAAATRRRDAEERQAAERAEAERRLESAEREYARALARS